MPKRNIDYSNTIIYKICCKDESIKDVYVGNTTNFIQRKNAHKTACNYNHNNIKLYKTIRENGGWDNWNMVEIAKYNCKDSTEARIKEQEHYELLKSSLNTLNTNVPYCNYYCTECDYNTNSTHNYNLHLDSVKHKNNINKNNEFIKNKKYSCQYCNYETSKHSDYKKHLNTNKHKKIYYETKFSQQSEFKCCSCGVCFNSRTTLWRHKQKCINLKGKENENMTDKDIIIMLIKENLELKNIITNLKETFNDTLSS